MIFFIYRCDILNKKTQNTREVDGYAKLIDDFDGKLESCPIWAFDGSSTRQAEGESSDCLLKPVAIFPDPTRSNGYLVMNEVLNSDGTPHDSNARSKIQDDDNDFWFGFEQEYFIMDVETQLPLGFGEVIQVLKECTIVLLVEKILMEEHLLRSMLIYV